MSQQADVDDERRVSWPQRHHQNSRFVQATAAADSTPQPLAPTHQITNHNRIPIATQQQLSTVYASTSSSPLSPQKQLSQSPHNNICYSSSGHPETYSVLPVGHGNFLKVYHTIESDQPQIIFNNYELFSSNISEKSPSPQAHQIQLDCSTSNEGNILVDDMHTIPCPPHPPGFGVTDTAASTTNMIINKLVNNWSPNLTGTYTQFEDQSTTSLPIKSFVATNSALIQEGHYTAALEDSNISSSSPVNDPKLRHNNSLVTNVTTKTNGNLEKSNNVANINSVPELKKRIVAEVKPMRMSYSDVLSKINSRAVVGTPNGISCNNQGRDPLVQNTNNKSAKPTNDNTKISGFPTERKVSPTAYEKERSAGVYHKQAEQQYSTSNSMANNSSGLKKGDKKSSPAHENKPANIQNVLSSSGKSTKKIIGKSLKGNSKQTPINNLPVGGEYSKKKYSKRDEDQTKSGNLNTAKSSGVSNDKEGFYNVAKTDSQFERFQKYTTPQQSNSSAAANNTRKARLSNVSGFLGSRVSSSRFEKQQQQMYSNRRGQNRGAQKKSSDKYEPLKKLFTNWLLEYTVRFLTWLFYLVYDIVVIGFSIVYERLSQAYASGYSYFLILRQDLKNNSNKPSIWIRNYLKKIDSKFRKNSKWAFWRRFYKKKPIQSSTEFYKTGRLPQTGEEAMYSLLNCKGKDAYSILGVPANSSQEQIRKHYKKIAVLVHPDKNKQPGAEEAFKVLQRAFELIGEPENRAAYDQSLVEALHAEKAWTELHDLLSQLQTKIAEAANTIRCSSCGFRHPRKMTDRPHYAARECGSCNIRHSAREGDIWAETNWLRLRWKYLALMEGKVYDITEWANCQKGALSHLQPNSHIVQYRIVRGGQQQQNQQKQQQQQQHQNTQPKSGATLDEFLDNLYSGQNPHGQSQNATRRRPRRN